MENTDQKHYICLGGCKRVALHPGVCQNEDCANYNHELVECNCDDQKHNDLEPSMNEENK